MIKLRNDGGFKLYAYCIIDNHLHLTIEEETEEIARIVKRVGTISALLIRTLKEFEIDEKDTSNSRIKHIYVRNKK